MKTNHEPGITVWFPASGMTVHEGVELHSTAFVAKRGQRLLVTEALRDANRLADGRAVWDLSVQDQIDLWGSPRFLRGEPPADLGPDPESGVAFDDARTLAIQAAHAIPDEDERRIALAKARDTFGIVRTSKTLQHYGAAS